MYTHDQFIKIEPQLIIYNYILCIYGDPDTLYCFEWEFKRFNMLELLHELVAKYVVHEVSSLIIVHNT